MSKDTGGPAFPRSAGDYSGTKQGNGAQQGMSLRDYFAAKAMQSLAMHEEYPPERAAKVAYEYADAMLKARAE